MLKIMKKTGILALSFMVAISMFSATPFLKVKALDQGGSIVVEQDDEKLVIGNDYISREFSMVNNKLVTTKLTNKRTSGSATVLEPKAGSEEFIIQRTKTPMKGIDRSNWSAEADSYQNASGSSDGPASNLLDGNVGSIWHTGYNDSGAQGDMAFPFAVNIDMNEEVTFKSFAYTPRSNGVETNGNLSQYALYAANTEMNLDYATDASGVPTNSAWTLISSGTFVYDDVNPIYVDLAQETTANQLVFVALSAKNGKAFAGGAEFELFETTSAETKALIEAEKTASHSLPSSEFTLKDVNVTDTTAVINNQEKVGKKVTFTFEPQTFNGVTYNVKENIVMYEGDHFMRKYLEISVPKDQALKAEIDYIDLESFVIDENYQQWSIPRGHGSLGGYFSEFISNLGQPIYVQGMFMGCEFPATNTEIVNHVGYMRYYSGKTFDRLVKDEQAAVVGDEVVYNTWQTVYGAARSIEQDVIQADFFDYIYSIATPSEFRIQYNSWFDNMMFIDDQNILETFIEFDRELSKAEVRPLDSYVIDDGWTNYNQSVPTDATKIRRSGKTVNKSGFWEFNEKFPDELYPSSTLANKFGSNFGLWVGPRGGYNYYGELANIMTAAGTGSKAGGAIDVADRTYVKNFAEMACDWQDRFHVNYWKWDGFANQSQFNEFAATDAIPAYSETNRHMTGGFERMYHVSDLWEAWIDLFDVVRQNAKVNNLYRFWISLTCYVMPSPWFLQWANSVWIQCSADQADAGPSTSKMDKQMTYRDGVYYEFLRQREFQFPAKNIYNHDPIYGVEGTGMNINSATTEQFQNYLYMQSTRGTMFWELYFSDSIMTDEKYAVTAEFLEWAEKNQDILSQSKMFGGDPTGSVNATYGYACFNETDGIMSLRNPDSVAQDITFTYDRNIGVKENTNGKYHIEHQYRYSGTAAEKTGEFVYGETYTITLQPDEVRIFAISENGDTTAPVIERAYTDGANTITVKFNEKVTGSSFVVNGVPVSVNVNDDDVSFTIKRQNPIPEGTVVVEAKDIKDIAGNACVDNVATMIQTANKQIVATTTENLTGSKVIEEAANSVQTDMGFSVNADVKTTSTGALVAQEGAYELGINAEGYAYFSVNGTTATATIKVNDGAEHCLTGVLENNGMVKIYVDKNIDGAKYSASNQYFVTPTADIVTGNASFSGDIAVSVFDKALGYDDIAADGEEVVVREPLNPSSFTIDVTSIDMVYNPYDPEANPGLIFDESNTTYWTSAEQTKGIDSSTNMVINLNGTYKLNRIDYMQRYDSKELYKCTGNLYDIVVEVSMDGTQWQQVAAKPTVDGITEVNFTETEAKYVRIWGNDSYFWKAGAQEYMTVAGLKLYGELLDAGGDDSEDVVTNLAYKKTNLTARYADGSSMSAVNTQRPLSMVVDGIKTTSDNYADMGSDSDQAGVTSAYFQVDLEDVYAISDVALYRYWKDGRSYTNSVIAISKTEDFSDAYVVYNSDVNNIHGFGAGTDAAYEETSAGKSWSFDETLGRYVRVYMSGSTSGNTMHIVELEVYGKEYNETLDLSALETKISEALAITADGYTTESYANLQKAIENAELALGNVESNDEVMLVVASLQAAIDALEIAPEETVNVTATVVDYKTIQLTWNEIADATAYVVERLSNDEWIVVGETNEPSYLATGVKTGKEYTYRVKAIYEQSEGAYSEEVSATPMLSGEVELSIAMNGTTKFDLTWTAVEGATRYIVYRKSADSEWKKILTLGKDARSYTSKDMQPNTYQYQVKAARYDSSERVMTNGSNVVEGIVLAQDVTPTNVKVENVDGTITLTWDKVAGMTHYEIYRSKNGGAYRHVKTTNATTLTNTTLKAGCTYSYKIKAYAVVNGEKVYGAEVETAITIE